MRNRAGNVRGRACRGWQGGALAAGLLAFALLCGCAGRQAAPLPTPDPAGEPASAPVPALPKASPETVARHEPTPTPAPTPFSIAWITDTQTMTMYPSLAPALLPTFRWIAQSREEYNTQLLIHTGDFVENGWNPLHWERINPAIALLEGELPFLPVAGNHDVAKKVLSYEPYLAQPFIAWQAPERQYRGGEGYYERFTAGGTDFLVLGLGYLSVNEAGLAWAREVFRQNDDCVGILAVHSYLSYGSDRTSELTGHGALLRQEVVAPCGNVRMVLSGHVKGNALRIENFDDDGDGQAERQVVCMRHNYQQNRYPDQVGYLRMLIFDPVSRAVSVLTCAPAQGSFTAAPDRADEEHFTIENAF